MVAHLHATVPRLEQWTPTLPPVPTPLPADTTQTHTATLCERIMALSDTIISAQVDCERTHNTAKTLSEVELC
jgi:hypothetical protein